jgi:hypothetical protein
MIRARGKAAMVLLMVTLVIAGRVSAAGLPAETRWADPSSVELNIEFPGEGYHASWALFRCSCGDLLVSAELAAPEEVVHGDLLLVSGKAVLTKGFGVYQDEAAASLDAAALMMQLALRLLERSEPGGPAKIMAPVEVDLLDSVNHIYLDTGYAEGSFQAPWSVAGTISAKGDTLRIFDLNFTFTVGGPGAVEQGTMKVRGQAEFATTDFPVPGSSSIGDWELNWRDENDAVAVTAETLDGLRAQLREK